jgi:hypothetical protein
LFATVTLNTIVAFGNTVALVMSSVALLTPVTRSKEQVLNFDVI